MDKETNKENVIHYIWNYQQLVPVLLLGDMVNHGHQL